MNLLKKWTFTLWYFRDPPWDTNITPPELVDFVAQHPPGKALDLGCGTGTNAIYLVQHGWQATGVDFANKAIRMARHKAQKAGLRADFRVADVTRLKGITGPFDFILDMGCYHNLSATGMRAYQANIDRLLKVGGHFLLYAFFREGTSDSGSGVAEADLKAFSPPLELLHRQDGSERGIRRSAWLHFQKIAAT